MWFATRGGIQNNAWLVSFVDRILGGCQMVLEDLLNEPDIAEGRAKITRVRALLYQYDFTRLDTEWARRIPGTKIVDNTRLFQHPGQVWTRELVGQYLPPLEPNNTSLRDFLRQAGYAASTCIAIKDRCANVGATKFPCYVASSIRMQKEMVLLTIALACCLYEGLDFSRRTRTKQEKSKVE